MVVFNKKRSNPPKGFAVEIDCPEDKETRKLFHQTVRSLGSSKLDSETVELIIWDKI
jgi:hypothetical protein